MKAAVYYQTGGPEVLKYEDVAEPLLRPGGVLIDVAAIAKTVAPINLTKSSRMRLTGAIKR